MWFGSPYCVHRYEVDPHLGSREELASLRQRLAERGLKLMLDFVPNHVAPDHPWIESTPDAFIQGTAEEFKSQPGYYFQAGNRFIAMGRDPYFPAWTDTAQLNAFSPVLRQKVTETLLDIASQCDAVRCDMAMLITTQVFTQTWGTKAGNPPAEDYWRAIIPAIKAQYSDFLFIGEVYWDMEWEMQNQGFDYTYDKRLYDRLRHEPPRAIRAHLQADLSYQERLVRLLENHDEECVIEALGQERGRPAGILITTLPGATLSMKGSSWGIKIKIPVQLGRRPVEPDYSDIEAFYCMVMNEATHPIYHEGEWSLREVGPAWDLNATNQNLIAYTWRLGDKRRLIVINYSSTSSQGRASLPDFGLEGHTWRLLDVLHDATYERDGGDMAEHGLYIDLHPWESHIFTFRCC